jgi:hypothetical protein
MAFKKSRIIKTLVRKYLNLYGKLETLFSEIPISTLFDLSKWLRFKVLLYFNNTVYFFFSLVPNIALTNRRNKSITRQNRSGRRVL